MWTNKGKIWPRASNHRMAALDFGHVIDHLHQTNAYESGMIGRILSRRLRGRM
ncbi:hypothetical protein SXCC_03811 [Gluconacetobacter sp. SXCC-1]|nr:hypothetical protein SXCC_03811 [Gluconacetobacter sp. SXCC-1]